MCRSSGSARRDRRLAVLPVMLLALLGACASAGGGGNTEPGVNAGDELNEAPAHVVVNNHSWDQVTVYITQGTAVWRLGDVAAMTQRTLPLKHLGRSLMGRTVQFIGRRLAGGSLRSETFDVNPGGGIPMWTIENQGAFSYVMLR